MRSCIEGIGVYDVGVKECGMFISWVRKFVGGIWTLWVCRSDERSASYGAQHSLAFWRKVEWSIKLLSQLKPLEQA